MLVLCVQLKWWPVPEEPDVHTLDGGGTVRLLQLILDHTGVRPIVACKHMWQLLR